MKVIEETLIKSSTSVSLFFILQLLEKQAIFFELYTERIYLG